MKTSRRNFIKSAMASTFGFSVLPSWVACASTSPNSKLNVAIVGAGGRGTAAVNELCTYDKVNVVAFCDVDDERAAQSYRKFPDVLRTSDYRRMLDKLGKDIDAVAICTPDHAHYPIATWAMEMGKHIYVEKPLTRTIKESRMLKDFAVKNPQLITQMGNQGHTYEGWRKLKEWNDAGIFGDIVEIHHWTDRPFWPQGALPWPDGKQKIPATLDYKLWLNVAPKKHKYAKEALAFNWRGIRDFGTGSLGDMGCHFMDWGYSALDLGFPTKISGWSTEFNDYSWPLEATAVFEFAGKNGKTIKLYWYDGKKKKPVAANFPCNSKIPQSEIDKLKNGSIVIGTKESAICTDPYGNGTMIYPRPRMVELAKGGKLPAPTIPRIKNGPHRNWADSCIAGHKAVSDLATYACDFNQVVLLGLVPNFFPGRTLEYDGKKGEFTNIKEANKYLQSSYEYNKEFLISEKFNPMA